MTNLLEIQKDTELFVPESSTNPHSFAIYPFKDFHWINAATRFGIPIPKNIINRTMGTSKCAECGQVYSGNQYNCTKLRWGYKEQGYYNSIQFGNMSVGDYCSKIRGTVRESKEYPCGGYLRWTLQEEFQKQSDLFYTIAQLNRLVPLAEDVQGVEYLSQDHKEKVALGLQIEALKIENQQLKDVVSEICRRLEAGGAGLLGGYRY